MTDSSIDMLAPARLARLLDTDPPTAWSQADAAAALAHQLAAPLLPDLAQSPGAEFERLRTLAKDHASLLAALTQPTPPASIELLLAIKNWARSLRDDRVSPLSHSPATVLYYAAIAAARVHRHSSITSLAPAQITEGFNWSARQPGADPLRPLFQRALETQID